MVFGPESKRRMYRLRARRWTREIAVAAAITAIAVGFVGAAMVRSAWRTQATDFAVEPIRPKP